MTMYWLKGKTTYLIVGLMVLVSMLYPGDIVVIDRDDKKISKTRYLPYIMRGVSPRNSWSGKTICLSCDPLTRMPKYKSFI